MHSGVIRFVNSYCQPVISITEKKIAIPFYRWSNNRYGVAGPNVIEFNWHVLLSVAVKATRIEDQRNARSMKNRFPLFHVQIASQ